MKYGHPFKVTLMPAGHGDCFLVQCDGFNILVDSGPHNASIHKRVHSALISTLEGQPIHLAIVTHNDDDHIGGLKRMLDDESLPIQSLLFNSPQRIRDYIHRHSDEEAKASARQALDVALKLTPCNAKAVVAGDSLDFYDHRIKLNILSPLGKDIVEYGTSMLAMIGTEELAGSRGRDTPYCGTISDLLAMPDDDKATDTSASNVLSLAFILTFDERSILFLGDSWPSRVTPSLAKFKIGDARIPLELVVVSHHGSKGNNTTELYRHINTERYVISTDGKQNPDVETFRRILRAAGQTLSEFHFSEHSEQLKAMFSKSDINARFPITGPHFIHV